MSRRLQGEKNEPAPPPVIKDSEVRECGWMMMLYVYNATQAELNQQQHQPNCSNGVCVYFYSGVLVPV